MGGLAMAGAALAVAGLEAPLAALGGAAEALAVGLPCIRGLKVSTAQSELAGVLEEPRPATRQA